jgi:hypothetical protein
MACLPEDIKQGHLFWLANSQDLYPHIQELYPYLKGGPVVVVKVSCHQIVNSKSKKKVTVSLVDFLYSGNVYSEGVENFCEKASYINKEGDYYGKKIKSGGFAKSFLKRS